MSDVDRRLAVFFLFYPLFQHISGLSGSNFHSCPILSNRFHPTKQHSICCRSENCISLAISGQSAVDSIDSFDLSNGKVYYRFDKCGRRSDNCISLVTTATRCNIVESIGSFDWWEYFIHDSTLKVCRTGGYT